MPVHHNEEIKEALACMYLYVRFFKVQRRKKA